MDAQNRRPQRTRMPLCVLRLPVHLWVRLAVWDAAVVTEFEAEDPSAVDGNEIRFMWGHRRDGAPVGRRRPPVR